MTFILGFNGPPRSGKDSIAQELADRLYGPVRIRSLSMPMRLAAFNYLGLDYSDAEYERLKDEPLEELGGGTIREWMIGFSERFIKPQYGHDAWARKLANNNKQFLLVPCTLVIVPDIGFAGEVKFFENQLGAQNVVVVHLSRDGHGWKNDSRDYVNSATNILSAHNYNVPDTAERIAEYLKRTMAWQI